MRLSPLRTAVLSLALAASSAFATTPIPSPLQKAVMAPTRTEAFRARDIYRHPEQTLSFFGITPEMTVVEIWPGAGWYTEILAPYLNAKGQYIAAGYALTEKSPKYQVRLTNQLLEKLKAQPEIYGNTAISTLTAPDHFTLAAPGTADRVLTFRNVHNWLDGGYAPEVFAAAFTALKSGGELGVVEHRAKPGTSLEQMKESGYVTVEEVRQLAEGAGFKLVAASEINANPKDSKDYPEGVWTLPPTLTMQDKDREKYLAIGESDRMTLRFVKP
jgi:predicted methyltransferase